MDIKEVNVHDVEQEEAHDSDIIIDVSEMVSLVVEKTGIEADLVEELANEEIKYFEIIGLCGTTKE